MAKDFEAYDLIVTRERSVDAIDFNVTDWTLVAYLPGHTNFTGHSKTVISESPISNANVVFCLQNNGTTPCEARCVALQYDETNAQVWYRWPGVIHNGPNNVQQLRQQMTIELSQAFAVRPYAYLFVEVKGAGKLYLARAEITWNKPDPVVATLPSNIEDRIAALEAKMSHMKDALA